MNTIATQHKAQAYRLIDSLGQSIIVRQPPDRTASTNDMEKIFGASTYESEYGTTTTITAHVHQGPVPTGLQRGSLSDLASQVGWMQEADLILSVKLEDVLADSTKVYGNTIFDTARDVVVSGSVFDVTGTFRSGLAPLGPYILWVGLTLKGE